MGSTAVHAATITYVNQTFDNAEAQQWRTDTLAKTLDLDGDDVYGTEGYIAFATTPVGASFANDYPASANFAFTMSGAGASGSNPAGLTTLIDLPTGVTAADGSLLLNGGVGAGFYGTIDNPLGGDNAVGFAVRNTFGGDPNGVAGNVMTFTIGADTPGAGVAGATLRLGLLLVNDTFAVADFTRVQSDNNTGFIENFAGDFGQTIMFYDITDYEAGDEIEVWLQARSTNNRVGISGVTFDVVVPEPSSLVLASLGCGLLLRRRK
ncbi:MAG: PEP-CTERM sorting domain-containing protein [Planctomycetota bacterium]